MSELAGVAAALLGSVIGGTALAATRFAVGSLDPLDIAMFRYSIGALVLLPFAFGAVRKLQSHGDLAATIGLALLFFALYPYTFALALAHTTAVRGSLALSTMPLLTLAFAILLRREAFSWQRLSGVLIAVGGLAFVLSPKIGAPLPTAWKGDLIMVAAAAMQAVYNVLSRPYIHRIGALTFTAFCMPIGALALLLVCSVGDSKGQFADLTGPAWGAMVYLGVFGGALLWVLWSIGLRFATPTLVALTNTVNTLTASFLGAVVLGEPIGPEFFVGLFAVLLGIGLAMNLFRRKAITA